MVLDVVPSKGSDQMMNQTLALQFGQSAESGISGGNLNYFRLPRKPLSLGLVAALSATLTVLALPAIAVLHFGVAERIFGSVPINDMNTVRLATDGVHAFVWLFFVAPLLGVAITLLDIVRSKDLNFLSLAALGVNVMMLLLNVACSTWH
jgi:hypothetical protein